MEFANTIFKSPALIENNNHMVMSDVFKEVKYKYLNIDTQYCDNYRNTIIGANVMITLPEPIVNVKSIEIQNIEIPQSFFNIDDLKKNNAFKLINADEEEIIITLPNNQYTIDSLIVELNIQLADLDITVVKYNTIYVKIENNGLVDYIIDFSTMSSGIVDKYDIKHKLGWLLGFRSSKYILQSGANLIGESFVNLIGTKYLYVSVDDFSKGTENTILCSHTNSAYRQLLSKVTLNKQLYPFGSILPANKENGLLLSSVRNYSGNTRLHKFSIQLLDDCGYLINLNQVDFSLCLKICHE